MKHLALVSIISTASALALSGCVGTPIAAERAARERVDKVGEQLRPAHTRSALPVLQPDSTLETCLRYAVFNHPAVQAAYFDWRATVEDITPARSLPDPRFTFEADISDMLMTLMPGLMFDFMTPGKRAAMGREAAAGSEVAYRNYVTTLLRTATDVRKAWIEIAYADEAGRLYSSTIRTLDQALAVAATSYATGRAMVTLDDQIRLQNQIAEHHAHHDSVQDQLVAARIRFKAALGIARTDADPPWPRSSLGVKPLPGESELWQRAATANPELAAMRAMVEMAVAQVEVARKTGTPDFAVGAMIDLKASPLMVRPTASVTLPIWRDKISGTIAAAEARRSAAVARLGAAQLAVAAELAQMIFMMREADRMIGYIDGAALPNIDRILASAEAGYQSGASGAGMIVEARHMALLMRLERLAALRQREDAVADITLMIAASAPAGSPMLADSPANR